MGKSLKQMREEWTAYCKNHHVIGFSEDGNTARLLEKNSGRMFFYTMSAEDEAFNPKRLVSCSAEVISTCDMGDGNAITIKCEADVKSLAAELASKDAEIAAAREAAANSANKLAEYEASEMNRHRENAKKALLSHVEQYELLSNDGRGIPEREKVPHERITALLSDIDNGKYNNSVDENKNWIGEKEVINTYWVLSGEQRQNHQTTHYNLSRSAVEAVLGRNGITDIDPIQAALNRPPLV